ncbi:MAG: glycosyl hydrolase family 28-related protein, partial [Planctomycetota bacterium]
MPRKLFSGNYLRSLTSRFSASDRQQKRKRLKRTLHTELLENRQLLATTATSDFVLPADADVVDVTSWSDDPALNADPAAGNDDHAALQTMLDTLAEDRNLKTKIIYFPEGEYMVSQSLRIPQFGSNGASARVVMQGEHRDRVIIRLTDNSNVEEAVVRFQIQRAADAFRNAVRDLTIDIGSGNPEADGLRFVGSNQATVRNVHIQSSDPNYVGNVGLELGRINRAGLNENTSSGPLLIENVSIDGFELGIQTENQVASQTIKNITLTNQLDHAWVNRNNQNVFARNVTIVGNLERAIDNSRSGIGGVFTIVDSSITGIASADVTPLEGIRTVGRLYARNIENNGFENAIVYRLDGKPQTQIKTSLVEEYWSEGNRRDKNNGNTGGASETFAGSPDTMLNLPVQDSPEQQLDTNFSNWSSPGSESNRRTNPDGTPSGVAGDEFDDALAIQAAIDSGATTIYFPNNGDWVVDEAVTVRGSVERLIGLESALVTRSGDGVFRLDETTADAVVIERFDSRRGQVVGFDHISDQTIVARNLIGFDYRPVSDSPGDLFMYDVSHGDFEFRNQNVWARQLNPESSADVNDPDLPDQKILNDNANVWILGMKIENAGTIVRTINGGQTELLGVYRNNDRISERENPAFVTVDSALSVANFDYATSAGNISTIERDGQTVSFQTAWEVHASETRDGLTQIIPEIKSVVYTAFADDTLWDLRQDVIVDNLDPEATFTGEWQSSSELPNTFLDSDFAFSVDPTATATFTPDVPVAGEYDVFVRWVGESRLKSSHQGHTRAAPVQVNYLGGTDNRSFNQTIDGGQWVQVGTYDFAAGTNGSVSFGTNPGSNARKTLVDGVRFSLVRAAGEVPVLREDFPIQQNTLTIDAGVFAGGTYDIDAASGFLAEDIESNGESLSVTSVQEGIGGEVTFAADGSFTYTPQPWFTGWDVLEYTVTNGTESTTGVAQILVQDSF